jgi:hypothetical protein
MAITSEQIKFYKPMYVNDSLTNGGRIGTTWMVDSALNNLFRNIQSAERVSGIDLYRKFFIKNDNPNDLALINPRLYISNVSSGEDYFQISVGTNTDNQNTASGYSDWYGSGRLSQNIVSGETSFSVECKQASGFPDDCLVMLNDGLTRVELRSVGSPVWTDNIAAIAVDSPVDYDLDLSNTIVSAVAEFDDITPTVTDWMESSAAGTYDEETYPVILYNIGTIVESWTVTFISETEFTVTGAVTGSLGNGSILANFIPENTIGYYFNLRKEGWGGSFVAGDALNFKTTHSAQGVWAKESVPENAESQANNLVSVKLIGESN